MLYITEVVAKTTCNSIRYNRSTAGKINLSLRRSSLHLKQPLISLGHRCKSHTSLAKSCALNSLACGITALASAVNTISSLWLTVARAHPCLCPEFP